MPPSRTLTRPKIAFRSVDLPAPFGPMMPMSSPGAAVSEQLFRMFTPGMYPAVTSRTSTTSSVAGVGATAGARLLFVIDELLQRFDVLGVGGADVGVVVRAEVGVDHGRVLHHGVRVALGDHATLGHHDDPVGDVPNHVHVVLDE